AIKLNDLALSRAVRVDEALRQPKVAVRTGRQPGRSASLRNCILADSAGGRDPVDDATATERSPDISVRSRRDVGYELGHQPLRQWQRKLADDSMRRDSADLLQTEAVVCEPDVAVGSRGDRGRLSRTIGKWEFRDDARRSDSSDQAQTTSREPKVAVA